jgi:DNA-binding CsgD family transcriptional regulator
VPVGSGFDARPGRRGDEPAGAGFRFTPTADAGQQPVRIELGSAVSLRLTMRTFVPPGLDPPRDPQLMVMVETAAILAPAFEYPLVGEHGLIGLRLDADGVIQSCSDTYLTEQCHLAVGRELEAFVDRAYVSPLRAALADIRSHGGAHRLALPLGPLSYDACVLTMADPDPSSTMVLLRRATDHTVGTVDHGPVANRSDQLALLLHTITDELRDAVLLLDGAGTRADPDALADQHRLDRRWHDLSAREREVAALLGAGLRVPTIARRLFVSQSTVRNHLSNIFAKVGVASQAELTELLASTRPAAHTA